MLELELKKYKSRYNSLFPLKDTKENFIKVFNLFKGKEIPNKCLFKCSTNHANIVFLSLLMLRGNKPRFEKFNTFDFIDIYLQRSESYMALSHITSPILAITNGFGEMPNAQLINMTRYVLERDTVTDVWFYQRGDDYPMEKMLREEGFYVMNLDSLFPAPRIVPDNSYKYKNKGNSTYKHDFYSKDNLDNYKKTKYTNNNNTNRTHADTSTNTYLDDLI